MCADANHLNRICQIGDAHKKPRSGRGFLLVREDFSSSGFKARPLSYIAPLSSPTPVPAVFVSTNNKGSLCAARGPRGRGVRRRGASSSAGATLAAADVGAATVSINTNGSLGAASRLRRRAGRGVERSDDVSSIWSTCAAITGRVVSRFSGACVATAFVGAGFISATTATFPADMVGADSGIAGCGAAASL